MIDRRPLASVAIVGNDAVLAAVPATPVQVAHACLRRGFSVAVPASWGDELLAAEAVRRLASRERGPAVMCVCPFVRSRLLTPGPDLAPFLVSLVSPPVAVARYLRAAYGEADVHITYVGACPGADDPAIDTCLTPDAFLADLADHGIALSGQPLVFDSIVPPDRRRWCSLPGGVPTAEVLWTESDARTLIEIDRDDDVSTDLAQHIITREHVLLDLAPSLGCACSGAVGSVAPRSARVAVTALEPPRALGPVIDPAASIPLDLPVTATDGGKAPSTAASEDGPVVEGATPADPPGTSDLMESRLAQLLGAQVSTETTDRALAGDVQALIAAEVDVGLVLETSVPTEGAPPNDSGDDRAPSPSEMRLDSAVPSNTATPSGVRRHTPASTPVRHSAATIPKATASDGRPLPRAYIAKRRTPTAGVATVAPVADSTGEPPAPAPAAEPGEPSPNEPAADESESDVRNRAVAASMPNAASDAPREPESATAVTGHSVPNATARPIPEVVPGRAGGSAGGAVGPSGSSPNEPSAASGPAADDGPRSGSGHRSAAVVPDSNPSALIVLLVALLALGFFVLRSLN